MCSSLCGNSLSLIKSHTHFRTHAILTEGGNSFSFSKSRIHFNSHAIYRHHEVSANGTLISRHVRYYLRVCSSLCGNNFSFSTKWHTHFKTRAILTQCGPYGFQSHCGPVLLCRVLGHSETGTRCDWDTVPLCTCPSVPGTGTQ